MMARVVARLEVLDPGFARTRHGARTACATVLSGLTLAVVTSVFGVAEPLRITLFGAGACFFGALLVTDPHRRDRAHTFGWASVVSAVAIVITVELSRTAVWAAVAFLVLQMFLSYALRSWRLTDSSRRLHGWTDQQVEISIRRLRDDVEDAKAAARGDAAAANTSAPLDARSPHRTTPARYESRLEPADSLWLTDNLHCRLAEFALLLRGHPRLRAAVH